MSGDPFTDKYNPMRSRGVRRVFNKLRIERTDDLASVEQMYAHALDGETAEIRLSSTFVFEFLNASQRMALGDGDFSVGLTRRERWKKTTLGKNSGEVWFWGERDTANTFRKSGVMS
jgi:hypothetical protein